MRIKLLTIAAAAVLASGCSSIVSKSDYPVSFDSTPSGAAFVLTNRAGNRVDSGVTPATITLPAGAGYFKPEQYTLSVSKDGFNSREYTLTASLDGWFFGNIFIGGLIGMLIVDPLTGAMYKLPADVNVELNESNLQASSELKIGLFDSLTEEQKQQLIAVEAQ